MKGHPRRGRLQEIQQRLTADAVEIAGPLLSFLPELRTHRRRRQSRLIYGHPKAMMVSAKNNDDSPAHQGTRRRHAPDQKKP